MQKQKGGGEINVTKKIHPCPTTGRTTFILTNSSLIFSHVLGILVVLVLMFFVLSSGSTKIYIKLLVIGFDLHFPLESLLQTMIL